MVLALDLLAVGLRSGAATVTDIASLARRDVGTTRRQLDALAEAGYLVLAGERVIYEQPAGAVAADVRRQASALLADLGTLVEQMTSTVEALPDLVAAQALGDDVPRLSVELFHGESAVTDLWHHLLRRMPLRETDIVLPDASSLAVADPALQESWHQVIAAPGNRARVLGSVTDAVAPALQRRMSDELAAGVEIRFMHEPPSWFWVADGQIVALPLQWGEHWPTSVVAIASPALAGLASWAFDRLWVGAVSPHTPADSWDPLLRLMATGSTLEAAARILGISERTGRRRLADAMDHFGVTSHLALGVVWGQRRR
ncbi:hypothetical protein [Nocardioides sp.]|uniref:hypothetical protein n=1 Tax=Nocardioides sp. TaxID=35761 RepID=UPI0026217BD0|nr:hypothetical protein [Nocardioides sp.]